MAYKLNWSAMTDEERALSQFVQGTLNRSGRRVFIDVDKYEEYVKEELTESDPFTVIAENLEEFEGAVVFDLSRNDVSYNMATTVCAATSLLGIPRPLEKRINALGIKTVYDLADVTGNNAERQRKVFNALKDKLDPTALVHQVIRQDSFHLVLRDWAISSRYACIYTGENEADREFRHEVLSWLKPNSPVYGWNDDEIAFIKDISLYGGYALPSDWSSNHSYFGVEGDKRIVQSTKRSAIRPNKHYVSIVVSDGDNIQWLERDFAHTSTFGQRQKSKADYKMTWTFSPSLVSLCPDGAEYIYSQKKSDYFITGVSGIGYANCMSYPKEHLPAFAKLTADAMQQSDLSVLCLLDDVNLTKNAQEVQARLSQFTKYDFIKGGVWELDPICYRGGEGKIFWVDGKPFVSVKISLWHESNQPGMVTKQFLDEYVERINALPVCPEAEEGYTVINVHPWTMEMEHIDYIVSRLADHVELVYADELIELLKANVKR